MNNKSRRQQSLELRDSAARMAESRPHPQHRSNGEELLYRRKGGERSYIANFTKGLPHSTETGLLLNPPDYRQFVQGIQSGDTRDFEATPLGPANPPATSGCLSKPIVTVDQPASQATWKSDIAKGNNIKKDDKITVRAWESEAAGLLFDLQGPDAQALTMPPAPKLDSDELCAEMAELYVMALMRDTHFSQLRDPCLGDQHDAKQYCDCPSNFSVHDAIDTLKQLEWFDKDCCELTAEERNRHRDMSYLTPQNIFRGSAPGCLEGPHLSQFLLIGNEVNIGDSPADLIHGVDAGYINYGSIRADQRVRFATPCKDYMTTFEAWVDVQNGANVRGLEEYVKSPHYRFMTTPRDLATYVHYDALYEAYLNAALILLSIGAPFDPGLPFQRPDVCDKQAPFASFGGPHILSLLTEVATRALKAVRYQKFNTHRRLRPEALAGLIDRYCNSAALPSAAVEEIGPVAKIAEKMRAIGLLDCIKGYNARQNKANDRKSDASAMGDNFFLPMAFPEGSPMHPAYGAGHATVAGACVTIVKAFFDHGWELRDGAGNPLAFEPSADGSALVAVTLNKPLTVEGELNKVAANIAIGRDWAGVHYYTDYIESVRVGEQIALGILEEQRLCYGENFTMTVPLIDGSVVRI